MTLRGLVDDAATTRKNPAREEEFSSAARWSRRSIGRPEETSSTDANGLGGQHLGIGLTLSGAFIAAFLLGHFVVEWNGQPFPAVSVLAWILLISGALVINLIVQRLATRMPLWLFLAALGVGAVVVALDLAACWGLTGQGIYPTAAAAVGALLMSMITLRSTQNILAAVTGLGLLLLVCALLEERQNTLTFGPEILTIAVATIPPLVGTGVARGFRRMVQRELDLVLVQSTISQPRFAVGMLASEQLARLDLDAETLLNDVAQGRTALPLAPTTAMTAAALATALRLHLIEGRTETWLHHAISESEFLGPSVTLVDPSGLAGLLSPLQREGLLLTIWLLVGDARGPASVSLRFGPILPTGSGPASRQMRFPLELQTSGLPRRRVDPETWQAIRTVGPHSDSNRDGTLQVDIECSVDNPADA
ncbi:hypothetical protein [Cryobacterium roopkundense]|uniref:Uncharacterized protein n=1 Tax=Cryobacterium roopkundense TaxID=1001240 RepID=A0A7W8ZU28_9MICO|nr:hypothetical protein [Cryobacterium roopkundense]MBB5640078.1 hypothetical protein [Cryobacterium roopkundense]